MRIIQDTAQQIKQKMKSNYKNGEKMSIVNVIPVHVDCAKERLEAWQKENKDLVLKPGMFVKKEFSNAGKTEHMWVIISEVRGSKIAGVLDNDPIFLENIKCGDRVVLDRSEIEEHVI